MVSGAQGETGWAERGAVSDKEKRLDRLIRVLTEMVAKDYWGKVTVTLEAGQIVNVKEEKSHKW